MEKITIIRILEYFGTKSEIAKHLSQRGVIGEAFKNPKITETFLNHNDIQEILNISDNLKKEVEKALDKNPNQYSLPL